MEMTICNPQKDRLETITVSINETNTAWFSDCLETDDISMITDTDNGLLIKENNYNHPDLVYDVTRSDIDNDSQKAKVIREEAMCDN
jgi:hypothetical protein